MMKTPGWARFKGLAALGLAGIACAAGGAQTMSTSREVLGPHAASGRGCVTCHANHTARVNSRGQSADVRALWGDDVNGSNLKLMREAGVEPVGRPSTHSNGSTPDVAGLISCMSCHDGNLASAAMMQNRIYEKLMGQYARMERIPTLYRSNWFTGLSSLDEHPVGLETAMSCGVENWDCSSSEGVVSMRGQRSSLFVKNYGFFVKPVSYNNTPVVLCTTCHDPHLMNVVNVDAGTRSGLPKGSYGTRFFLRGPYSSANPNISSNQNAQFCRQCHGDLSNEMNGGNMRTVF